MQYEKCMNKSTSKISVTIFKNLRLIRITGVITTTKILYNSSKEKLKIPCMK